MELRDFAEQVLFATTLADKLACPDVLTDERPGPALAAPAEPGRPAELRFKPAGGAKAEFPGLHRLDNATERGRLLHVVANHELLATELMALVLLRFPDAPAAFRRGVLQTLRDEQEHTRLYVERMRACGLTFGELRVSGFFWRSVSGMASPLDYVAGLSLTFEQANLDFSRHFAQGFATVGDTESAALLERIYRDEIGHVAYGLKWFRRWKNPGESDWDAFCRQLKFPLTPRRAKGFAVNAAGRQAAGLDADFIAQLDVYSQSKGRTPNVFWFNPLSEAVLAQGGLFTPGKVQAALARDLAALPMFLAREDDVVLVPRRPAVGFLSGLKQAGFPLPEFVEIGAQSARDRESAAASWSAAAERGEAAAVSPDQTGARPSARPAAESGGKPPHSKTLPRSLDPLRERKLGRLRPWAWGPDSVEFLAPLFPNLTGEVRHPAEPFNPALAELYSKAWSADFLRGWLGEVSLGRNAFSAELRGLTQAYSRTIGELVSPSCRAVLGDARCGVTMGPYTVTGTIDSVHADGVTLYDAARTEAGPTGGLSMTIIQGINLLNHFFALLLVGGASFLTAFQPAQLHALALLFLNAHEAVVLLWGFAFGLHLLLSGYLIYQSGYLPRLVGVALVMAAFCYFTQSFGNLLLPQAKALFATIGLLSAIEIVLPLWLLVKGVNGAQWQKRLLAAV
jgi:uncharacterized ferritin-like protein (DUF455 family)